MSRRQANPAYFAPLSSPVVCVYSDESRGRSAESSCVLIGRSPCSVGELSFELESVYRLSSWLCRPTCICPTQACQRNETLNSKDPVFTAHTREVDILLSSHCSVRCSGSCAAVGSDDVCDQIASLGSTRTKSNTTACSYLSYLSVQRCIRNGSLISCMLPFLPVASTAFSWVVAPYPDYS